MNVSINCNSLVAMSESDFALFLVRLMAINQAIPTASQAPSVQTPSVPRPIVQTANKGPLEAKYNAEFGILRITDNPVFEGLNREQVAEKCLAANCKAGDMPRGVYQAPSNEPSNETPSGKIDIPEDWG